VAPAPQLGWEQWREDLKLAVAARYDRPNPRAGTAVARRAPVKAIACAGVLLLVACSSGGGGGGAPLDGGLGGFGAGGAGGVGGGIGGTSGAAGSGASTGTGGGAPMCPADFELCGSVCVNQKDDPLHCGGCDQKCTPGDVCAAGSCQTILDCSATPCVGLTYCDLASKKCLPGCLTDQQCASNEQCDTAAHACDCAPGHHRCAGVCIPESSISGCGASCTVCPQDANGQASCNGGQCALTCNGGFHDCAGSCKPSDSPASCGTSCSACPGDPSGTATCNAGQCGISCNTGNHLCGSQCKSDTSPASCGTSCTPCPTKTGATASCVAGACTYSCSNGVTLGAATKYATAGSPKDLAIGDVTGDGKLDVVVAGSGIYVHPGNGDGTFQPVVQYTLANGTGVAIGDINGDGKKDVVATAGVSNTTLPPRGLWTLTQTASGTLSAAAQVVSTSTVPSRVFLEDFSGDGKLDYVLFTGGLMFAAGNGNGTFGTAASKSLYGTSAASAEVTGDTRPDLVLAAYDKVYVVPGSASGVLGSEVPTAITYNSYYRLDTGDMNGDGKNDVVLGTNDASAAGVMVMTSSGGGALGAPVTQSGGKGAPVVGDFNKDGKNDIVQTDSYYVYLRLSTPSGSLSAPEEIYSGASPARAVAADLDNDGFSDLVIASDATWTDEIYVMKSTCK
jgi:FG-GAP-like repeat/Stigma-specific protein, Stig1